MTTSATSHNGSRRPEKVYRIGSVTASVFTREVTGDKGARTLRSVKLQKRSMDGNEGRYTDSFSLSEIPQAQRAFDLATRWLKHHEAELDFNCPKATSHITADIRDRVSANLQASKLRRSM